MTAQCVCVHRAHHRLLKVRVSSRFPEKRKHGCRMDAQRHVLRRKGRFAVPRACGLLFASALYSWGDTEKHERFLMTVQGDRSLGKMRQRVFQLSGKDLHSRDRAGCKSQRGGNRGG